MHRATLDKIRIRFNIWEVADFYCDGLHAGLHNEPKITLFLTSSLFICVSPVNISKIFRVQFKSIRSLWTRAACGSLFFTTALEDLRKLNENFLILILSS
jgi:hypothetical protein